MRSGELWAYNLDGTVRFRAATLGASPAGDSPIVGRDGTVYVRGDNTIVAVWDTLGPDPASPWPGYRGGASRRGTQAR
jgi:outer membrane protein assembly factor BamB